MSHAVCAAGGVIMADAKIGNRKSTLSAIFYGLQARDLPLVII
jgi:hypothetical protein